MNRSIKFRVWDKGQNQMSLVSQIHYADDGYAATIIVIPAPKAKYHYYVVDDENGVLMQSTGLKDNTGRDIYEGDIIGFPKRNSINKVIIFERGGFVAKWVDTELEAIKPNDGMPANLESAGSPWEIKGNIFENPELLLLTNNP